MLSPDINMAHSFAAFRSLSQMSPSHKAISGHLSRTGKPSYLFLCLLYTYIYAYLYIYTTLALYYCVYYLKQFILPIYFDAFASLECHLHESRDICLSG